MELLIGQVIRFEGDPMAEGPAAARHLARGAVVLAALVCFLLGLMDQSTPK